ncbi:HEAT repeat domain-containing protein [Candidatus Uabimicrobium amorphum]|uniref:HEAT repeat domain-containing protein n=1 Tax=Uabimicrobium amorphum TaxID=2596890 RepID=A0A5S9F531_UABAM|nr:HEAT repeat domain-containing protein [Candidatus Uabimicrobium amorphum]BBM86437.1 hypothetical protein UABAM_04823 [Candidatus Uabimicrobium amorphum]
MRFLMGICILFFSVCSAQEAEESRLAQLEKKVAAIQDFLSLELQNLKNDLKQQNQRSEILRKRNNFLLKKVKFLESKVKDLEAQILHNKVKNISQPQQKTVTETEEPVEQQVKFKDKKLQLLSEEIVSPNPDIRMGAVIQLGSVNTKEALQVLKKALQDKNPYVKVLACKIALQKNDKTITNDLFALLNDEDKEVRKHANLALETITNTQVGFEHNSSKTTRDEKILEWKKKIK